MLEENQRRTRAAGGSLPGADSRSTVASRFERFEKRQNELWRLTFFILFCLAVAYAWTSKDAIHSFAHGL
jgi:hypothetical protein